MLGAPRKTTWRMRVWRMTALTTEDEPRKEVLLEEEQAEDKNPGGEPYQILPAPDDLLPVLM